jgi:UDP-glucose 4-epimerase
MRANTIAPIVFASTGSIYGEPRVFPTPEDAPFPVQTSLYGASKLAAEGLICAYCEGFGFRAWIFRFVSVVGERYTHGHIIDFYRQLRAHPQKLYALGDGEQTKSYMYVHDCIDGMLLAMKKATLPVNILNLGTDMHARVKESIGWISETLGLAPEVTYSGGARGWAGDNPFIYLDARRMRALDWEPNHTIREGVVRTVRWLQKNHWLVDRRP